MGTVDAVVVGAGIVGASTAYHLARQGARVTVIDSRVPGEATAAGAGIVGPWLSPEDDPVWTPLAYAACADYPRFAAELAADGEPEIGFRRVGALIVREQPAELAEPEERLRRRSQLHPEIGAVTRLEPGDARKLFPPLADGLPAVHVEGAARVDGRLVRDALLRLARRHGATIVEATAGTGLRVSADRVSVTGADPVPRHPDAVVVSAGSWTSELVRPLGVELPLYPERGQILHLDLPGADERTPGWPVVQPGGGPYLLGFAGGRVVAGATRETEAGFDHRTTAAGISDLLRSMLAVAPGLADAELAEVRVGLRPKTTDGLPILGRVPGLGNLLLATGLGATGLTMGPHVGWLAAQLATGAEPDMDLAPFRPDR